MQKKIKLIHDTSLTPDTSLTRARHASRWHFPTEYMCQWWEGVRFTVEVFMRIKCFYACKLNQQECQYRRIFTSECLQFVLRVGTHWDSVNKDKVLCQNTYWVIDALPVVTPDASHVRTCPSVHDSMHLRFPAEPRTITSNKKILTFIVKVVVK